MKHVVEYKLHNGEIPYFIENGGYFHHEGKLIGITRDDVNCYVPPSSQLLTFSSREDFITYVVSISMSKDGQPLSQQEKTTLAENWWDFNV